MSTERKFNLVNGSFTIDEIKPILLKMVNDKIDFHQLMIFSWKERFGKPNISSEKRIVELENTKIKLLEFFNENSSTKRVNVYTDINISFED